MTTLQVHIPEKYTGIIQLKVQYGEPSYDLLNNIQDRIMQIDKRWHPVEKLHCTLMHQSFPKKVVSASGLRGDKALKVLFKSPHRPQGTVTLTYGSFFHCLDLETGRESIGVWIVGQDAELMRREIIESAGISYDEISSTFDANETSRMFHISLANLTGNGGDSPAYPTKENTSKIIV